MSSTNPKFIDVTGFPEEGEHVPPTPRAVELLVAQGWTPPEPAAEPLDCTGLLMHSIDAEYDECVWCGEPREQAMKERCLIWFES